ncbi:winged helix DNA-binding domain-containing protein [soil metagenome]
MRHVPDAERRVRLARRHALAPDHRVSGVHAATEAMTVLHSTEPASVYLSCWTRIDSLDVADVDRAVYTDRHVVEQLAMRRTLFVFPRDLLPAVWGSAARRTAGTERARMVKDVVKAGLADDGEAWLAEARRQVVDLLAGHPDGLVATEIRQAVPFIDVKISVSAGSVWSSSRVLTQLGATAEIVRAANTGHWRTSRPRWTLMSNWLDDVQEPLGVQEGYREIVRRWLWTFGPGTETDLVWWLGATKGIVRTALADLGAVQVSLDGGATGWLLPDDVDPPAGDEAPWVALLPVLDPTVMGWKQRDFYLGPHAPDLFDRNGNAGTTVWVDGRVVGCWTQDAAGAVHVHLLEDVAAPARTALDAEAARLTRWLDGQRIGTVYPSAAMKFHREATDAREGAR